MIEAELKARVRDPEALHQQLRQLAAASRASTTTLTTTAPAKT